MEWGPNEKMTTTDLRAVLNSCGIPTLSSEKKDLIAEVSKHYKMIMMEWKTRAPERTWVFASSPAQELQAAGGARPGRGHRHPTCCSQLHRL